jgi:hypothetical protein
MDVNSDGTCTAYWDAPVTFQDLPTFIRATWTPPDGGKPQQRDVGPNTDGWSIVDSGVKASKYNVFAVYSRKGTSDGNQCNSTAPYRVACREGAPNNDPCILAVPHRLTSAESPPPSVAPYLDEVIGKLRAQAGTINSIPNPNGIVNLPTCFWVDGITVADEADYSLVLAGPPDTSGRQIFYTFLIRLFFAGIDWNFDDPLGNAEVKPHQACGQHPQQTAHTYQLISEKRGNDDGKYHVTAKENYQLTVDMYWSDSYRTQHAPIDPGIALPIAITPASDYHQFVGQVEGIPIG